MREDLYRKPRRHAHPLVFTAMTRRQGHRRAGAVAGVPPPLGVRRTGLVIPAGFFNHMDIGLNHTSLSSFIFVRWVRVEEETLMLNVNGLCRRRWVSVLGLVFCAVFTPIAWGEAVAESEAPSCEEVLARIKGLFLARDSGESRCISEEVRNLVEFLEKGRKFSREEAERLAASNLRADLLKRVKLIRQKYPRCSGKPFLLLVQKMHEGGVLRIREEILLEDAVLRTVFTPDVMKDVLTRVDLKLRGELFKEDAVQVLKKPEITGVLNKETREVVYHTNEAYRAHKMLTSIVNVDDINYWNMRYGKDFDKMYGINYSKLAESFKKDRTSSAKVVRNEEDLSRLDRKERLRRKSAFLKKAQALQRAQRVAGALEDTGEDLVTQFLRSYSFLRALVKAGAVQFCWPNSLHEGVIPASDAVSEDEGCPTVEEEVMEDFIKLFKMLQGPNNPIEWEGLQKKETSVF